MVIAHGPDAPYATKWQSHRLAIIGNAGHHLMGKTPSGESFLVHLKILYVEFFIETIDVYKWTGGRGRFIDISQ